MQRPRRTTVPSPRAGTAPVPPPQLSPPQLSPSAGARGREYSAAASSCSRTSTLRPASRCSGGSPSATASQITRAIAPAVGGGLPAPKRCGSCSSRCVWWRCATARWSSSSARQMSKRKVARGSSSRPEKSASTTNVDPSTPPARVRAAMKRARTQTEYRPPSDAPSERSYSTRAASLSRTTICKEASAGGRGRAAATRSQTARATRSQVVLSPANSARSSRLRRSYRASAALSALSAAQMSTR
mmetsp:Transcript_43190/g.139448  ORF Transcript_43190/g.139448 Transcript_43190/m.139448 type:complete len:244 (-) Transcript_43190:74-805(-)